MDCKSSVRIVLISLDKERLDIARSPEMHPWLFFSSLLFIACCFHGLKMAISMIQLPSHGVTSDNSTQPVTTSRTTQLPIISTKKSREMSPLIGLPQHRIGCPSLNEFALQNWTVPEGRLTQGTSHITLGDRYMTRCLFRLRNLPRGKYCFAKVDVCPGDFLQGGSVTIKSVSSPDSPYVMEHCCRDDEDEDVAVNFPTFGGPFYLIPYKSKCQQIAGYDVTKEYWQWWLNYSNISVSNLVANPSPKKAVINMRVCYYAIQNYWPTDYYLFFEPPEGCIPDAFQLTKFNPVLDRYRDSFWLDVGDHGVETRIEKLKFCERKNHRLDNTKRQGFPTGQYCVLGTDHGCPHRLTMKKVTVRNKQGILFVFVYCCMVNGYPGFAIYLPPKRPFYLLPYNSTCPEVYGMTKTRQHILFINDPERINIHAPPVLHVKPYINQTRVKFGLCKYEAILTQDGSAQENDLGGFTAKLGGAFGALGIVIAAIACFRQRNLRRKARRQTRHKPIQEETPSGSDMHITSSCGGQLYGGRKPGSTGGNRRLLAHLPTYDKRGSKRNSLELGSLLKMALDPESQATMYNLLVHPNKIETMENIGQGAFGTVYRGRYRPDANPLHAQDVAIKTLKEHCSYPEINAFIEEAIMMADFRHANVLTMIGVCVNPTSHIPTLVLPFMEHGDLQKYLRKFRHEENLKEKVPEPSQLLSFCLHIARGMTYLSDMKFVHRDLAARNCMLDENMMVKVADFGLARDIYSNSYYRQDKAKLLPIKWMAVESLQDRVFSIYTDVWSYGVTLWEIFTLGKVPYPELENFQVLPELERGQRLPKPDTCPEAVYDLLLNCWQKNPKSRPTFAEICKAIEGALEELSDYLDLDLSKDSPKTADLSAAIVCSPADLAEVEIKESLPQTGYTEYRDA